MEELRYTLLTDGASDRALLPILKWLLIANGVNYPLQETWADLSLVNPKPEGLARRIKVSLELYPCDCIFIHRDAEGQPHTIRRDEILRNIETLGQGVVVPYICVIPVRMQEAWLLFNQAAIRRASGNPNGQVRLNLPKPNKIEALPDPKEILYGLIRDASELEGRRLKRLYPSALAYRVSELIEDFSLLRQLSAFNLLEEEIRQIIEQNGWGRQ